MNQRVMPLAALPDRTPEHFDIGIIRRKSPTRPKNPAQYADLSVLWVSSTDQQLQKSPH